MHEFLLSGTLALCSQGQIYMVNCTSVIAVSPLISHTHNSNHVHPLVVIKSEVHTHNACVCVYPRPKHEKEWNISINKTQSNHSILMSYTPPFIQSLKISSLNPQNTRKVVSFILTIKFTTGYYNTTSKMIIMKPNNIYCMYIKLLSVHKISLDNNTLFPPYQ